jgi:hypothetical protein
LEDLSPEERNLAEIHIAKHRNGPTGMVKLFFDESRASFRNLDKRHFPPPGLAPSPATPQIGAGQSAPSTPF